MSKFTVFILALLLIACLSEKNIDPANATTFIRYFSDGYVDTPVAIEETSDNGFIILVNSNFKNSDADSERERIQLIKTDAYGHKVWSHYYPDSTLVDTRWSASSVVELTAGGYLIAGEEIQGNKKQLLFFTVSSSGKVTKTKVHNTNFSLSGKAAISAIGKDGVTENFILLGQCDLLLLDSAFLAEFSSTTLSPVWQRRFASGDETVETQLELTNKLYYSPATGLPSPKPAYLFFAGTQTFSGTNALSFVSRTELDNDPTNGFQPIIVTDASEFALDLCRKGNEFGLVGYVEDVNNLGDIYFCPIQSDAVPKTMRTYTNEIFDNPDAVDPLDNVKQEKGNAIISTSDGGYMMLATIDTYIGQLGKGNTDMLLLKTNGLGDRSWSKTFGTPDIDAGVSVRQTSDGGYVILGRTRLAALQTVVMIKTDKTGNVD